MKSKKIKLKKGVFTISLDTELVWGSCRYRDISRFSSDWYKKRKNVTALLKLFNHYEIPATWAFVGHLFLDKCNGKHQDVLKTDGWHKHDPGTDLKKDPLWYGKDILKLIKKSKTNHEIACHSFSHVDFDICSSEIAQSELNKCQQLFAKEKLPLVSFVFPREKHAHHDALKKVGIKIYRKKEDSMRCLFKSKIIRKILRGFTILNVLTPDITGSPNKKKGLWELPANTNLITPINATTIQTKNKFLLSLFRRCTLLKFKKTINAAIKRKEMVHITLHPYNIENMADLTYLSKMLKYVYKKKKSGRLDVLTMQDVYKEYLRGK